ncbi:MAG: MOSC domain-containing protein [Candidatus Acetothermia bacterium]
MATGRDNDKRGELTSINTSEGKGEVKTPVSEVSVLKDHGIEGDVHAGSPVKQVSLLDSSEIRAMEDRTGVDLKPGDFAENLTTTGLDLDSFAEGDKLRVGADVLLEVSQIGKTCHEDCVVKEKTGECIMPEKGLFFRVLEGGEISQGDPVEPANKEG